MLNSVVTLSGEPAEDGPQEPVSGDVLARPAPVYAKRRAAAPDFNSLYCDVCLQGLSWDSLSTQPYLLKMSPLPPPNAHGGFSCTFSRTGR